MKKLLPLLALAALALPARAVTLDTEQFGKYAEFTVSGYAGGNTAVTDLPVLVRFSAANMGGLDYNDIGLTKQAAYSALRFADANGDNLDYEIATWDPTGESTIWVSLPSISGTATKFTAYFVPDAGYTLPPVYPTNVWTKAGYIGVWHLDEKNGDGKFEDSSGVTGAVGPQSGNAPNPTPATAYGVGNYLENNAAGLFIPASVSANWNFGATGLTVESWALPGGDWEQMFASVNTLNTSSGFMVGVAQNKLRWSVRGAGWDTKDGNKVKAINWSSNAAQWRHFAITYKASGSSFSGAAYVGWPEQGTKFEKTAHSTQYEATLANGFSFANGCWLMNSINNTARGIDEIRIRASETTEQWAKANYMTQKDGFLTYTAVKVTGATIESTAITVGNNPTYSTETVSGTFNVDSSVTGNVAVALVVSPTGETTYTVPNVGTISTASTSVSLTLDGLLPGTHYAVSFSVTYNGKTTSSASASFTTKALPVPTLSGVGDTAATLSGAFSLSGAFYTDGTANAVFTETLTGNSVPVPVADLSAPTATATTLSPDTDYRVRFVFERSDGLTVQTRTVLCSTTGTRTLDPNAYASSLAFTASGYTGSSTLANFPVLVRLSTAIRGFDYANVNRSDIRFADANGTLLAHDVEWWDTTGTSLVWVSLPSLSGTTTTFTMYWNPKSGATVPAARAPQRVWTLAGYAAVWHFSDQNSDGSYPDASGYGATAVRIGGDATPNAPTTGATSANDSPWHVANSYLKVDVANTADWFFSETGYTVETWIRPMAKADMGGWNEFNRMFAWGGGDTTGNIFIFAKDTIAQAAGDSNTSAWPSGFNNKDEWRLVTGLWDPANSNFATYGTFCNGTTQALNTRKRAVDFTDNGMGLTGTLAPKGLLGFPIDEVRIRRGYTTPDWRKANYDTQVAGSTFVVPEETVTLTFPAIPEHVSVAVTVAGKPVEGVNGVYTVEADAEVVVTFAADTGYVLTGAPASTTLTLTEDTLFPSASIPTTIKTATLTLGSLPANVTLISVTTNGIAVGASGGVYTVYSNATVVATFAAAEGYRLVGAATVTVVMDEDKTLTGIPTATMLTAILTIGMLPANVTLVSVTTNGIAVAGSANVYTVHSNATVIATFAAAEGYRLVGDATITVVMDKDKTLTGIPTAELIPSPTATVTLTIPAPPANVTLVSVTTNDMAVAGNASVYMVFSNATVVATFAAAEGYRLLGAATVTIVMDEDKTLTGIPTAELIPPPVTLTIPSPLPANVSLVSVTTNGIAVVGSANAYTVYSNATVVATFAAAEGYRLVGDATITVVMDENKTLTGIPTAELIPIPTATLTIPAPLPVGVSLVSVTTNGVAISPVEGAYTVFSNATATVTFAPAEGYRLVGGATVTIVVDGDKTIATADMPTAEPIPAPEVSQSATKVHARKTVTLTASAEGATSYYWLKNGEQIEGGENGTLTVNWRSPKDDPTDTYRAVAVYNINDLPVDSGPSAEMTVENLPMPTVFLVLGEPSAPPAPHDYSADYLTFRVLTPGTICWKSIGNLTKTIEYKVNNGEWTSITSTSDGATISVAKDDLVRFRGGNTAYATSKSAYSGFEGGTATYDIEGNIMSLLYGDNFAENTTLPNSEYIFCSLFKKAPVISAEHLILPATTLKNYCYRALFSYCTTLTKAPELPATTLATGCYWYMFEQCAITEAPVLEATTLVNECYGHMFEGCGLLNKITCLATSGFGTSNCLADWVKNVAGDGVFAKAANVTAWKTGASGIPTGWIECEDVLLVPPEISFDGETIELECDTVGAEIHYRLGQTGDFALYTQPISIVADTVVEAYSTCQDHTSETVTQTCVYVHETPFQRANKDLPTWRYGGSTITTPYSVNAIDGHSSSYSKGTFSFDTSISLKEVQPTYLWFQHADQSADIYVDNVNVGTHWGGYNAFFFDISEYVHRGKNDIRVALRNNRGNYLAPAAGDFNFNATLGNVKLFTSPVLPAMEYGYDGFHITSTVSASSATTNATIYIETKVPAGADLKCIISDGSYAWTNTLASTGSEQTFTNTISNAHLWNGTLDPHLYTVTLEIYKDGDLYHRYQRPYGFRYYEYVINEPVNGATYTGFLLNGRPYPLRGVCMHDDVEGKANALTDSDYDQEFAIIQELGCNFIRLAHYPHPKEVYDRCDRLGIIVQTEVPCVNKLQSTMPSDYYTHLETQYIEMVEQHFNHPCIMFWGLSNETTTDDKAFGKEKIEGYYDLIKRLDSERLVGYVMSHSYNNPSAYYNDPEVDWFGCNIYVGWYIDKTSNDPSSQLNTRIKNTITDRNKPLAFSEYGCGGTQHCHSDNFKSTTTSGNNPRHDIEYQMWLHEGHIAAIRNYPQLLFTGQWQLFDIAVSSRQEGYTECLDGENATTNDDLKYLNNKGLVERDHRTKKDTFYLYKAEWNSTDKFVHICGKDYTKTTQRKLKCYTNDGDTLSLYVGNDPTPLMTANVVDHIAEFEATDFTPGVEIIVRGATTYDTVTFE